MAYLCLAMAALNWETKALGASLGTDPNECFCPNESTRQTDTLSTEEQPGKPTIRNNTINATVGSL